MSLQWLSQNEKMKRSSIDYDIYNWGIPAFRAPDGTKTCPNAGLCAAGCYARSGAYRFSNVAKKYQARLDLSRTNDFEPIILGEIDKANKLAAKRDKSTLIRLHDSGDFYSLDYTLSWLRIMRQRPTVPFYAYTKQVQFFKDLFFNNPHLIRPNFVLIYSYGGKQDKLINPEVDRHSKVFQNETELASEGYSDASHNDTVALGDNHKIGLIYHGTKKYNNTQWDKVKVSK